MAVLLVAMSVMAVMMTVAMPVWKHQAQREKEEELVFRGLQYVHAIGLYQRKFANSYPPTLDVLVEQRFVRKKYKDPITNDDFVPIPAGASLPGSGASTNGRGTSPTTGGTQPAGGAPSTQPGGAQAAVQPGGGRGTSPIGTPGNAGAVAGISGVTSKSKDASIRLYNGRGHYNEWAFVYTASTQTPGAATGAGGANNGRGQNGQPGPPGAGGVGGRSNRGNGRGGNGPNRGGQGGFPGSPNNPGGRGFGPGTAPTPLFPQPTTGRF
jgi:type II secretory pathway pseudopilin PulG